MKHHKHQEYIVKTQIHGAVPLLMQTDLSMKRVAWNTEFCDRSSLTYYFRRKLGITPHRFQKAARVWNASEGIDETHG
ncbi:MAG: helix-turn-helix domain-containing protein [Thermogutta sp.]